MTLWWISAPQCMGMLITNKALVVFLSLRTDIANRMLSVFPCSSFLFPVKPLYNLDEDQSQDAIAVNLLPLLSQSELGRVTAGASNQSKRYLTLTCGMAAKMKEGFSFVHFRCLIRSWSENLPISSKITNFFSFF